MRYVFSIMILAIGFLNAELAAAPKIAIVIDDLGHHRSQQRFTQLPGALTLAILPQTPYATVLAQQAEQHGKEVIIHMPMEASAITSQEPSMLWANTPRDVLIELLSQAFTQLPQAVGMNNHMGSHLTTLREPMVWIMVELAQRNMYFLDSRTSAGTQAEVIARKHGVPAARRHVFLDNTPQYEHIAERWQTLILHAQQHGEAIAIAHPHPATYDFLETQLPQLDEYGVQLVFVSELVSAAVADVMTP